MTPPALCPLKNGAAPAPPIPRTDRSRPDLPPGRQPTPCAAWVTSVADRSASRAYGTGTRGAAWGLWLVVLFAESSRIRSFPLVAHAGAMDRASEVP